MLILVYKPMVLTTETLMGCVLSRLSATARPRSGITIVEILLVLAVISILAAIILPMFVRSRELSYQTVCANNLRQFSVAFYLYSQDWSGSWPCPGGLVGDRTYWAQSGNGGLQPYVRQRGLKSIWCCPRLTDWHGIYPARSYSMNSYLRTPCDVEYPSCVNLLCGINTAKLAEPGRTILLYEGIPRSADYADRACTEDQVFYIYRCANWTWVRGYYGKVTHTINPGQPWHGRLSNYLYADGHIVARPPGRRLQADLSSYREMRQWYVDKKYFERIFNANWARWIPRDAQ